MPVVMAVTALPVAEVPAVSWLAAMPGCVATVVLLWIPGLSVARRLGLRGVLLAAVAPLVSFGVIAGLAASDSTLARGVPLGHPLVVVGLLGAVAVAGLLVRLPSGWPRPRWGRGRGSAGAPASGVGEPLGGSTSVGPGRAHGATSPASHGTSQRVRAGALAVACLVSGATFVAATGAAGTVEQSNDSPFHLLAIQRVAGSGDLSWQNVRATTGSVGFYPPLFDDVAAVLVRLPVGLDVVAASSVLLLVLVALVWPLGVAALVREVAPTQPLAVLLVPATAAFPAHLVQYGALWPNLLGIALVPATVALGLATRGWVRGVLLLLAVATLALAHPDAMLSAGVLVYGLAVRARRRWRVVMALVAVVGLALLTRSATMVTQFEVAPTWTLPDAVGRVLALDLVHGTHRSLVGVLAVVGIGVCLVARRERWLVVGWASTAVQVVLAGAVGGAVTHVLTGLWYHEPARLGSALAVAALVLAAVGLDGVHRALLRVTGVRRRVIASVLAVAASPWWGVGVADVYRTQRDTYVGLSPGRTLVTPQEAAFYASTLRMPAGTDTGPQKVVGDPFGGAMFAGLYSGRENVVAHFGQEPTDDMLIVRSSFRELASSPAVCAAVRRAAIGYAVEDTSVIWTSDSHFPDYAGLRRLDTAPGLQLVAREGTVSVYRLTVCR